MKTTEERNEAYAAMKAPLKVIRRTSEANPPCWQSWGCEIANFHYSAKEVIALFVFGSKS